MYNNITENVENYEVPRPLFEVEFVFYQQIEKRMLKTKEGVFPAGKTYRNYINGDLD